MNQPKYCEEIVLVDRPTRQGDMSCGLETKLECGFCGLNYCEKHIDIHQEVCCERKVA